MKLTYFRLKGYINILNGMGIDELVIPFNTFKNRIILISGQNGTGKSTIIKACYPNPDSNDSYRTDVFIDNYGNRQIIEYPAEKELIYEDIDTTGMVNTYRILIQSIVDDSKTRRTTKAFISRNGEELNPNGNVSSFKEIRDNILGTDPTYMDLSSISSENRGIVDMIPSDRRRYMANYIGSLETYNNIYKTISKKVTNLKSYMNTINNKLYELGNENELRLKQMQLEAQYENANKEHDELLRKLTEAETVVKILDPDNKIQDLYNSISERLQSINGKINENHNILVSLQRKCEILPENDNIVEILNNKKKLLSDYESQQMENKSNYDKLTSINETLLKSIENDKSTLSGLTIPTIQDNIEKVIEDTKDKIEVYNNYITEKDKEILDKVSKDELIDLKNSLDKFLNDIMVIEDQFPENDFIIALEKKDTTNFNTVLSELKKSEHISELEIELIKSKINETKENLENLEKFNATRPVNCVDDKCPFIANFISLQNSIKNGKSIDDLEKELQQEENNLVKYRSSIESMSNIASVSVDINTTINILRGSKHSISKIKELEFILNDDELISRLKNHNRFYEFDIVNELIEKKSVYDELIQLEKDLSKMEIDYQNYLSSKGLVDKINLSISEIETLYNSNNETIKGIIKDNIFLDEAINSIKEEITSLESYISYDNERLNLLKDKDNLRIEFETIKDNISKIKSSVDSVNSLKSDLNNCDNILEPLLESINKIKFNLTNIVEYQKEYQENSDKYDKLSFIRNCCSPGNGMGIQSEYIKRYMSDIIIDCNKMLSYMFDGSIQLDVPIIDEKSFKMPFISLGGIPVPDISMGSTAQKCMIGLVFSCVAMMKSSLKYNIPRLDEIDGGLDQSNRITFIQVLNQILNIMNSEQCIICSHNSEFDTYSTTRIICSMGGIRIEQ